MKKPKEHEALKLLQLDAQPQGRLPFLNHLNAAAIYLLVNHFPSHKVRATKYAHVGSNSFRFLPLRGAHSFTWLG